MRTNDLVTEQPMTSPLLKENENLAIRDTRMTQVFSARNSRRHLKPGPIQETRRARKHSNINIIPNVNPTLLTTGGGGGGVVCPCLPQSVVALGKPHAKYGGTLSGSENMADRELQPGVTMDFTLRQRFLCRERLTSWTCATRKETPIAGWIADARCTQKSTVNNSKSSAPDVHVRPLRTAVSWRQFLLALATRRMQRLRKFLQLRRLRGWWDVFTV